jgi:hypothetical protein
MPPFGGNGGNTFFDHNPFKVERIDVRYGAWIDAIITFFNDSTALKHGGEGGTATSIRLEPDECISAVDLSMNSDYIEQIIFYTSRERKFGPFGQSSGKPLTRFDFQDKVLVGFTGRSDQYLNALGFLLDTRQ